jgi:electron transport complex protein RnfG
MKDILKLCLSLGIICTIAGALLSYVNKITLEPRIAAEQTVRNRNLKLVLPPETDNTSQEEEDTVDGVKFFRALDQNGRLLAYAAESTSNKGFGGEVRILVGISLTGEILGVIVSSHSETPGIGTLVTDRKTTQSFWDAITGRAKVEDFPPNEYLDAYTGKKITRTFSFGSGENQVLAVSGATISSKAVLTAVNAVTAAWQQKFPAHASAQP